MSEDKCCGNCCWFYGEMTEGKGFCAQSPIEDNVVMCEMCCKTEFVSRKEMRHHMAVLLQHNRWRRDDWYEPIYRHVDPVEVSEAIDFAYKYMKVFSKL